jgi:lambda family phage portal protein
MDLNLFERGIAKLSPQWGLRRIGAKVGLEQATVAARAYDAARRDRRTDSWRASGGSANAELAPSLSLIIKRSRDLCRNNEWSINGKRKWVAHLVGTGIVPRPDVTEPKAKKVANDAWNQFSDNCDPEGLTDYYGIQARLAGEVFEGGAAFLRWYLRPSDFGLKVPLQCEVLEHDFLDTKKTEVLANGNVVVHGVEYDSYGRRVAYWLFPVHPGEVAMIRRASFQSNRISADELDHVFRVDRAGQVTGVPWLAPSMLRLRDAADYEEAELVRKKIEACFTVFVRRNGTGVSGVAQAVDQTTDAKDRRLEKIAPGTIAYVEADGDITTAAPVASGDGGHMDRQLYAFAAGIGLTYSQVSGNLSNVNFTSLREGKLDFWPVLDQAQWNMMIPQTCRPAWRRVMRVASGRGLQVSADTLAKWSPPKRPWVNPADDLRAAAGELALGLESWAEMVTARGYDPQELLDEIKQWGPKLIEAGLSPGAAPGLAGLGNGAPP